jgi:hypothetical protein
VITEAADDALTAGTKQVQAFSLCGRVLPAVRVSLHLEFVFGIPIRLTHLRMTFGYRRTRETRALVC